MIPSDIDDDYILKNFNINQNRKTKIIHKDVCEINFCELVIYDNEIYKKMTTDNLEFSDVLELAQKYYKTETDRCLEYFKKIEGFQNVCFYTIIESVDDDGGNHGFGPIDTGFKIIVKAKVSKSETDKSIISRLKSREKQKIKKQKIKSESKDNKMTQIKKLAKELNLEIKNK
jgi:hypothetical protein